MRRLRTLAFVVISFATAMAGFADLSKQFADWPRGPVQWLMTRDDQRAWRDVKTDEQAQNFIDLFWARRDRTPNTPLNEFRSEFEGRVAFADKVYASAKKRGSLTDPGRVYILLGPPQNAPTELSRPMGADINDDSSQGLSHGLGGRMQFVYPRPMELGLSGPVVFIESLSTHEYMIDFQHGNAGGALARAIENAIVNPGLKEVPEWARSGIRKVAAPAVDTEPRTETVITKTTITRKVPVPVTPAPAVLGGAPGAHDLALLANVRVIRVGEDDPFAKIEKKTSFRKNEDLGFALQFCTPSVSSPRPKLTMSVTMSGKIDGEPVNVSTPEDDTVAEPIRVLPGCYLVRGAIPVESLAPGSYQFFVNLKDADGKTYTVEHSFNVE